MNRTVAVALPLFAVFVSACCAEPAEAGSRVRREAARRCCAARRNAASAAAAGAGAHQRAPLPLSDRRGRRPARSVRCGHAGLYRNGEENPDPRIAQRATEIALFARAQSQALEAAQIWVAADPESVRAQQALTALLVNANKLGEAKPLLAKLLKEEKGNVGPAFLQLSSLLSRAADKKAALQLVRDLAQPYPTVAEAHLAVAQAALGRRRSGARCA